MPAITLPDGTVKEFEHAVSVGDVAASIGPGLAKAALAGRVNGELVDTSFEIEGITNMPAYLQRFLAERSQEPGFSYEVAQDPVRGWIVSWKEYTNRGTVRGYGQFYERPYAWLDD